MENQPNNNIKSKQELPKKCPFHGIPISRWIRFGLASLILVGFAIWLNNYTVLLLLTFLSIYILPIYTLGILRKSKNKTFRKTMEWVDAILYALVAVYLINTFFFQNYKIPSSSLENFYGGRLFVC